MKFWNYERLISINKIKIRWLWPQKNIDQDKIFGGNKCAEKMGCAPKFSPGIRNRGWGLSSFCLYVSLQPLW